MADPQAIRLHPALRGVFARVQVDQIEIPEDRSRTPDLSPGAIAELAGSIKRQGLQQPIGIKKSGDRRYLLIWGRRRLEAYRVHKLSDQVPCMIYFEDLPVEWAKILEIDENEKRQDLSVDERTAHTVELAAEIKKIEGTVKSDLSDFTSSEAPTTGRGHKGIVQKVAEIQKVDHAAVRKRAQKVANTIGEPVDLQKDSPAELTRKAAKFRAAPKAVKAPRPRPAAPQPPKPEPVEGVDYDVHVDRHGFKRRVYKDGRRPPQPEPGPAEDGLVAARRLVAEVLARPDLSAEGRRLAKAVLAEITKVQATFYAGLHRIEVRIERLAEGAPDVKADALRLKIRALAERPGTEGERAAAEAALGRLPPPPEPIKLTRAPAPLPATREEMLARARGGSRARWRRMNPGRRPAPTRGGGDETLRACIRP